MAELRRIEAYEITLGDALPWPLYNMQGGLLFERGQVISSRRHLEALLTSGLFRTPDDQPPPEPGTYSIPCLGDDESPFDLITQFPPRLTQALNGLAKGHREYQGALIRIAREIQYICEIAPDEALGAVHLFHDGSYPIIHLLHTAILCELISHRLGYRQERRIPLLCATLTSNISIIDLQEKLHTQSDPLTDEQKARIQSHPEDSAAILKAAGVNGELWLKTVLQHHECVDGSGYGQHLKGSEILRDARIMALADVYSAMITPRNYKGPISAKEALKELFLTRGKKVDQGLSEVFIKELGVFPPGAYVEMNNGERGIVIKRGRELKQPVVAAMVSGDGAHYSSPIRRAGDKPEYCIKQALLEPINFPINLRRIWSHK